MRMRGLVIRCLPLVAGHADSGQPQGMTGRHAKWTLGKDGPEVVKVRLGQRSCGQ